MRKVFIIGIPLLVIVIGLHHFYKTCLRPYKPYTHLSEYGEVLKTFKINRAEYARMFPANLPKTRLDAGLYYDGGGLRGSPMFILRIQYTPSEFQDILRRYKDSEISSIRASDVEFPLPYPFLENKNPESAAVYNYTDLPDEWQIFPFSSYKVPLVIQKSTTYAFTAFSEKSNEVMYVYVRYKN